MIQAPHEIELKLRIEAGAITRLLRHPALAKVKQARARRARLRSIYFDTPDGRLASNGVALRVRKAGHRWLQTIKGPATLASGGGLTERVECEWPLRRSQRRPPLDLERLAATPYRHTIEKVTRRAPLDPVFVTEVERTWIPLRFSDRTRATLCLDQGFVHAGERPRRGIRREPISEIELELASGNSVRLFDLALDLSRDLPIALETRSKAERGYALVLQRSAAPVRADALAYPRDATALEALAAILRNCLRQITANADGMLVDDDPEWIHQMRVGMRRLRSALALARKLLPTATLAPLISDVRELARTLGDARDLDVFADETLPAIADARRLLAKRAKLAARKARAQARAVVASPRFAQAMLAVGRLAAEPGAGATAAASAKAFAAKCLKHRLRKVSRAGARLEASPEARHALRIAAKQLRYTAEFFAPLFAARRVRAFTKPLARLQDALGAANDAARAAVLAAELSSAGSPAAVLVAEWAGAQTRARTKALARAWNAFRDARPFWTGH